MGSGTLTGARVTANMLFADDTHAVSAWWAEAFGVEQVEVEPHPQGDFVFFEAAGVELGFHAADPGKNAVGGSPVVYFSVPSVEAARARLLAEGAAPHRGPLAVSASRSICQLRDPFGNVFGLDGPP
ncbi:MAG TPA: VOC family protein [Gaiellaceae bacterium]